MLRYSRYVGGALLWESLRGWWDGRRPGWEAPDTGHTPLGPKKLLNYLAPMRIRSRRLNTKDSVKFELPRASTPTGLSGVLRRPKYWGPWVALSVKCPTLDFRSGRDLTVGEFEP